VGDHYLTARQIFTPYAGIDIAKKLKSAVGKQVIIIHSAEKHITATEGVLTDFDESQQEAEINHDLRVGTQVIRAVCVL